jgi:hypothetical protein
MFEIHTQVRGSWPCYIREITGKIALFVGNRFATDDALGEIYTKLDQPNYLLAPGLKRSCTLAAHCSGFVECLPLKGGIEGCIVSHSTNFHQILTEN